MKTNRTIYAMITRYHSLPRYALLWANAQLSGPSQETFRLTFVKRKKAKF